MGLPPRRENGGPGRIAMRRVAAWQDRMEEAEENKKRQANDGQGRVRSRPCFLGEMDSPGDSLAAAAAPGTEYLDADTAACV